MILGYKNPSKLNLYHNDIPMFYEKDSNMVLDWLDLGANRLKIVSMTFDKRFIGFANSVVDQFIGEVHTSVANLTNVEGLNNLKIIGKYIVLAKNKLTDFGVDSYDIRRFYNSDSNLLDFLDLSNCSIIDIPDLYFSNLPHCINLNLSYNSIGVIDNMTFKNSKIDFLDLSHSNIKELRSNCFTNNTMKELILSYNQISQLNKIFVDTTVLKLDLSHNEIVEITMDSFKNLLGTVYLNLSNNFIEKFDSNAISEMKSLDILDLTYNRFKEFASDTFAYFSVTNLLLQGNNISDVHKNAFDHLENVKLLNLSNNHIKNIRPKAFANLSSVEEIDLANNDINFVVADTFFQTPNLRKVDLSGNPLKQIFKISNSLTLNELIITVDSILNSDEIDNFYLKILIIKDSKLEALNANTFRGLYTLRSLFFENTTIDTIEPGALNNLFSLQYLDTKHIFNGTTDLPKDTFKDLVQLEEIDLSDIGLETMEQWCFNGLESLTHLNLNHNKFVEIVNGNFLGLPILSTLLLESNNISKLEDGGFNGLYSLKQLTLADNKLVYINDGAFKYLWRLNKLNLQNNQLIQLEKDVFQGLVNLIELDLSNNRLTVIPSGSMHYLRELKSLRLQYNNISVLDVGSLSELKLLEVLDLSHNELTYFNTRTTFLTLKKLLQLYLDRNKLKGLEIDELLKKCPSLKFVGLSFNDFVCDDLALILLMLENHDVAFKSIELGYDSENIEGIQCVPKNPDKEINIIRNKYVIKKKDHPNPIVANKHKTKGKNVLKLENDYFIRELDSVEEEKGV